MATQLAPEAPFTYRTSPTAIDAFEQWLAANPQSRFAHTHPWDVSRSDIYVEDRWGPIFADMRAKAPINKVSESPYGAYWNVVSHKAIQHVESLPELFSSGWQHGGITIGDPPEGTDPAKLAERQMPMFIAMDRPEHTGQRRTVAPAFTPREMVRMEEEIRARTGEVLDSLPWGERFDWVDKVSIELTTGMLAILFGFPWKDRRLLTFWSDWAGDVELTLVTTEHLCYFPPKNVFIWRLKFSVHTYSSGLQICPILTLCLRVVRDNFFYTIKHDAFFNLP